MNLAQLSDPLWRIQHLYSVKDEETGLIEPFRPTAQQLTIARGVYERNEKRILVLKARRARMSTIAAQINLDGALWNAGHQGSIVDQSALEAAKKMDQMIRPSLENLPAEIRSSLSILKDNDHELSFQIGNDPKSAIYAGLKARGGNNNVLHITEHGPIQFHDPKRSKEIITGAFPSARRGIIIDETTWEGRKGGHLWPIVENALAVRANPENATGKDFTLYFFPWWEDPEYTLEGNVEQIDAATNEYLDETEARIRRDKINYPGRGKFHFTPGQRLWYFKQKLESGLFMFNEFPSLLEECWQGAIQGAIYLDLMDAARTEGRIELFPWAREYPVLTFWDLGAPDQSPILYVQFVGREVHVIDYDAGFMEETNDRVKRIHAKPYNYGPHYLPHDADATQKGGISYKGELERAGLQNLRVIPRTPDIWLGIDRGRQLLPRTRIHAEDAAEWIEAMENYHRGKDDKADQLKSFPVHDWSSHGADCWRHLAEADLNGMIESPGLPGASLTKEEKRKRRKRHRKGLAKAGVGK